MGFNCSFSHSEQALARTIGRLAIRYAAAIRDVEGEKDKGAVDPPLEVMKSEIEADDQRAGARRLVQLADNRVLRVRRRRIDCDHFVDGAETARKLTRRIVARQAAGALVLGLPICVRLKIFVNSARIENDMLSP